MRDSSMNEVQIFQHEQFGEIRTVLIDGEVWFVGKDVAAALGYSNTRKALIDHVMNEDKRDGVTIRDSIGRNQNPTLINESGMYSLILSSKLESALEFKRWVTREVLPSIRENGIYITPELLKRIVSDPAYLIGILQKLLDVQNENTDLREQNKLLQEKTSYLDIILASPEDIPITIIAKDYGMSGQRMNDLLLAFAIQFRLKSGTWVLYQEYADCGYTRSHTHVYDKKKGKSHIHTYWTQKGRRFLYEKLKENGILPMCERGDSLGSV